MISCPDSLLRLAFFTGPTEILVICGVIVLLFGATAIPKFARNIGKAKKEFEKGLKDGSEDAAPADDAPEEKSEKAEAE